MAFSGFPPAAFEFYERLAADNSRPFWLANKSTYEDAVRGPLLELLDELSEFGPFQVFRPYRDVRFAKNKTPYKENIGAFGESEGGAGYYVHLNTEGMFAGSGYYHMASDQLERFRAAVDADTSGSKLATLCAAATKSGMRLGAIDELKTAPRGYPKDHPRVELLRRKGLFSGRDWPRAKWMSTKAVVGRVRDAWTESAPINRWLDQHVGPSTLPPDESGWGR
jgi:uncharacterized protein (TIGR02453 family)